MVGKNAAFCTSLWPLFPYNVHFNTFHIKHIMWMQIDTDEVPSLAETKEPSTKTSSFNILNYRHDLSSWLQKDDGRAVENTLVGCSVFMHKLAQLAWKLGLKNSGFQTLVVFKVEEATPRRHKCPGVCLISPFLAKHQRSVWHQTARSPRHRH